jgi:hypothetical protein
VVTADSPDPLVELALSEAIRALDEQQAQLGSARSLAGLLVGTIGIVAGTLATAVFRDLGSGCSTALAILGVVALALAGTAAAGALWPVKWSWTTNGQQILGWKNEQPARRLAGYLSTYATEHEPKLKRIWLVLRGGIVATALAIVLLLAALGLE